MIRRGFGLLLLLSILPGISYGQMPITNIVHFEYEWINDSMHIKTHKPLTSGNGYNNQPSFSSDCKYVFFTSNRNDSTSTDLFRIHIGKTESSIVSDHPLSEYSPNQDPNDPKSTWHVRVESDNKQHLRKINPANGVIDNMCPPSDSVGYYALSDGNDIGLIILNKGLEFHTYVPGAAVTNMVRNNTGRFLNYNPKDNSYVFLGSTSTGDYIYRYDRNKKEVNDSIIAIPGCIDYGTDHRGSLYGGADGLLFMNSFTGDKSWRQIADLRPYVGAFYRLNFCKCGRHMCLVTYEGKKP